MIRFSKGYARTLAMAILALVASAVISLATPTPALAAGGSVDVAAIVDDCNGTLNLSFLGTSVDNDTNYYWKIKGLGLNIGGISDFKNELLITGSMSPAPSHLHSDYTWEVYKLNTDGKPDTASEITGDAPVTHACMTLATAAPTALPSPTASPSSVDNGISQLASAPTVSATASSAAAPASASHGWFNPLIAVGVFLLLAIVGLIRYLNKRRPRPTQQ